MRWPPVAMVLLMASPAAADVRDLRLPHPTANVALSPAGHGVASWVADDGTVLVSRRRPGGRWRTPAALSEKWLYGADLHIGARGDAAVVYQIDGAVEVVVLPRDLPALAAQRLSPAGVFADHPLGYVDGRGRVRVSWEEGRGRRVVWSAADGRFGPARDQQGGFQRPSALAVERFLREVRRPPRVPDDALAAVLVGVRRGGFFVWGPSWRRSVVACRGGGCGRRVVVRRRPGFLRWLRGSRTAEGKAVIFN